MPGSLALPGFSCRGFGIGPERPGAGRVFVPRFRYQSRAALRWPGFRVAVSVSVTGGCESALLRESALMPANIPGSGSEIFGSTQNNRQLTKNQVPVTGEHCHQHPKSTPMPVKLPGSGLCNHESAQINWHLTLKSGQMPVIFLRFCTEILESARNNWHFVRDSTMVPVIFL